MLATQYLTLVVYGCDKCVDPRAVPHRTVVRASGPFTVESLSPHRVLRDGPEDEAADPPPSSADSGQYVTSILDNLRRAGVENTKRNERLELSSLDPYPGVYVQATGECAENGHFQTVAVAIGPEFGTVGPELIREAAKGAVRSADLLLVCGFAFDPLAVQEASVPGLADHPPGAHELRPGDDDELLNKTPTKLGTP